MNNVAKKRMKKELFYVSVEYGRSSKDVSGVIPREKFGPYPRRIAERMALQLKMLHGREAHLVSAGGMDVR